MPSTTISFKSRWQRIAGSVLISPIVFALALLFALISVPQIREIYVSAVEPGNGWRLLLGLIAIAMLSTSLFFGYLSGWWVMRRTGVGAGSGLIYPDAVLIKDDRRVMILRDGLASFCAAAPFLGVFFGVRSAARELAYKTEIIEGAAKQIGKPGRLLPPELESIVANLYTLSWIVLGMMVLLLLALLIGGRLRISDGWRVGWQRLRERFRLGRGLSLRYPDYPGWRRWMPFQWRQRMRTRIPLWILVLSALMLFGSPFALAISPESFSSFFRAIGPLATLGMALMTLATLLFVVGDISRKMGVPIMLLVLLVTVFWGIGRYLGQDATVTSQNAQAGNRTITRDHRASALAEPFRRWLETRADRKAFEGRMYPVFVIAAQGGGIYAAGSATAVLSQMQDTCSNFAQHVFAISSVSGGSIGSVLFAGNTDQQQSATICDPAAASSRTHIELSKRVVRDDHLSATMAAAVPDILYNLGSLLAHEVGGLMGHEMAPQTSVRGRAEALECSILLSYYRSASTSPADLANICRKGATKPSRGIGAAAFETAWPSRTPSAAPALVLNTTRTETGDRVAYAPFALKAVGDGTLLAFSELEHAEVQATVLEAAVTSARFPAMMPAKVIPYTQPSTQGRMNPAGNRHHTRWRNFVDGGYADSSGATTALEIYYDLWKLVRDMPWARDVDLRLVLLTDDPSTNGGEPPGDGLVHAISPLITLFSVRSQMARRAVNRAVEDVQTFTNTTQKATTCDDHDWRVRLVMLDQQSFSLPLGWMMSTPTAMLVERMVGTPTRIDNRPSPVKDRESEHVGRAIKRAANILYNNSCTMYSMTELLAGKTEPIKPAQP
jgi:hypothetical protein